MDGALIAGTGEEEQSRRNSANSNNDITTADLHQAENAAAHRVRALHPREQSYSNKHTGSQRATMW